MLVLGPVLLTAGYSLTTWDGIAAPRFVGAANYLEALSSDELSRAAQVTIVLAVTATTLLNLLGLSFAVLLNRPGKLSTVYRTVLFYPFVLSPIVVGFLWRTLLSQYGVVNTILGHFGVDSISFLAFPNTALASLIFVVIWQQLGFVMAVYLAALQGVPRELTEAATLDGASRWNAFRHVTLPMIAPAITINVTAILVWSLREYDRVVGVTGGGPARSTESIAFLIVDLGFYRIRLGYASAVAVLFLLTVATVSLLMVRVLRWNEARVHW